MKHIFSILLAGLLFMTVSCGEKSAEKAARGLADKIMEEAAKKTKDPDTKKALEAAKKIQQEASKDLKGMENATPEEAAKKVEELNKKMQEEMNKE
ncbi:MAG TPA: hypothetical protein VKS21_08690 [Spirochaetota bacterium]|nr:hypothetical protein [Spirochaetota bacterium]